jgi:hypothetical protein
MRIALGAPSRAGPPNRIRLNNHSLAARSRHEGETIREALSMRKRLHLHRKRG